MIIIVIVIVIIVVDGIGLSFWLISDLPISGWFEFPYFRFSVYRSMIEKNFNCN